MAENNYQPKTYTDQATSAEGGMNSGVSPLLLEKNQIGTGVNVSLRGGYITHRPPFQKKQLNFNNNSDLQSLVENGFYQGSGYYRPDFGTESLIAQYGGRLVKFTEDGTSGIWNVTEISIPGDLNDPLVKQVWMRQAERWLIITDGTSKLPIFYDGSYSRRSLGSSQVWGTTSAIVTIPAIGNAVTLFLASNYTGRFDVPVLFHGEYYQPQSQGVANTFLVGLTNITDSAGATHVAGEEVNVIASDVGVLKADLVVPVFVNDSDFYADNTCKKSGSVLVGQFVDPLVPFIPFNTTIYSNQKMVWVSGKPKPPNQTPLYIGILSRTLAVVIFPLCVGIRANQTFTFLAGQKLIGQNSTVTKIGSLVNNFTAPAYGGQVVAALSQPYTGGNVCVWINGKQYLLSSVAQPPATQTLILTNLTDGNAGQSVAVGANVLSVPELPAGRMGAYGMGRYWMSLIDGISYIAGDIVGSGSGTTLYNKRDSVLKTTENDFLKSGGTFRLPGTGDIITAMLFPPTLDSSLGQGPLQVCTAHSIISNNSPVNRDAWKTMTSPIQSESLKDKGALSHNSTILINSDTYFRSDDGIGSLILARRDFGTWGNKTISNELQRFLNKDIQSLLAYGSAISFDNRFQMTCAPQLFSGKQVLHIGCVALNYDLVSSLRQDLPAAWEGVWTGLNIYRIITGRVNSRKRAFAFTYNFNLAVNELSELLPENTAEYLDDGTTPIAFVFETPVLFGRQVKPITELCQLRDGECYLSEIRGNVSVEVYYRPDFYPCWTLWKAFNLCQDASSPIANPTYQMRVGLGEPSPDPVEIGNNRPLRNGQFFQFRVQITGSCVWNGMKVSAIEVPQPMYAQILDDNVACTPINCVVPNDLRVYSLNGLPDEELPSITDTAPPFGYANIQIIFSDFQPPGDITYTGSGMPNWIHLINNEFVGDAGVFSGGTQGEADDAAKKALDEFIKNGLETGDIVVTPPVPPDPCPTDCPGWINLSWIGDGFNWGGAHTFLCIFEEVNGTFTGTVNYLPGSSCTCYLEVFSSEYFGGSSCQVTVKQGATVLLSENNPIGGIYPFTMPNVLVPEVVEVKIDGVAGAGQVVDLTGLVATNCSNTYPVNWSGVAWVYEVPGNTGDAGMWTDGFATGPIAGRQEPEPFYLQPCPSAGRDQSMWLKTGAFVTGEISFIATGTISYTGPGQPCALVTTYLGIEGGAIANYEIKAGATVIASGAIPGSDITTVTTHFTIPACLAPTNITVKYTMIAANPADGVVFVSRLQNSPYVF